MKHTKTVQCHMLHNASGNQFSPHAKFTKAQIGLSSLFRNSKSKPETL